MSSAVQTCAQSWKRFCRMVEDPATRKFLRTQPADVERCAVFEFTREQSEASAATELDLAEPIPPFPFERVAVVHWNGCVAAWEPVEEGGTLRCQIVAVWFYEHDAVNQTSAILAEADLWTPLSGAFAPRTRGMRTIFFDEGGRARSRIPTETAVQYAAQLERRAARVEDRATPAEVAKLREGSARVRKIEVKIRECEAYLEKGMHGPVERAFRTALKNVAWINGPGHYTVRQRTAGTNGARRGDPDAIRRLHDRPTHIVLTRDRIEYAWHGVHGDGSKMPHLRRGHYRTLRSEMWINKRGQTVWVRPAQVGGARVEWEIGRVHYVVVG